jgi:hypothetical protein
MQDTIDKGNFYQGVAQKFKTELKWRSAKYERLDQIFENRAPLVATVKVDGELQVFHVDVPTQTAKLYNRFGRVRWDTTITRMLLQHVEAAGYKSMTGFGELFALDDGALIPFNLFQGIAKKKAVNLPKNEEHQLRLAVFDIFSVDDEIIFGKVHYADRFALVHTIFEDGRIVQPIAGQDVTGSAGVMHELWAKHILAENYEGLVLRINDAVKVKVIHSFDVVPIGVTEGTGRLEGKIGALAMAFRDEHGHYLYAGKVGTGLTDKDREWWQRHAQRTGEAINFKRDTIHMIRPQHVIQVLATSTYPQPVPTLMFLQTGKWADLGRQHHGAILREPRFDRMREDKTIAPEDVRIAQIPGWAQGMTEPGQGRQIEAPPLDDVEELGRRMMLLKPDMQRAMNKIGVPRAEQSEVLAEVFVRVVAKPPTPAQPMFPYMYKIAQHFWLDKKRHSKVVRKFGREMRSQIRRLPAAQRGQLSAGGGGTFGPMA